MPGKERLYARTDRGGAQKRKAYERAAVLRRMVADDGKTAERQNAPITLPYLAFLDPKNLHEWEKASTRGAQPST